MNYNILGTRCLAYEKSVILISDAQYCQYTTETLGLMNNHWKGRWILMFDFGNANDGQRNAIVAAESPVLITAGPGTGKTYTLV